jgi:hypothetical protein
MRVAMRVAMRAGVLTRKGVARSGLRIPGGTRVAKGSAGGGLGERMPSPARTPVVELAHAGSKGTLEPSP